MNVKLDYAQRRRANELVEWVIDNPDDAAYELIGLRDALAAQPATVRQTLCEKCGRAINSSTHSYSDLGGYECYSPTTGDELLRKQIAAALNKSMNPGAVNRAMEDVWPVFEAYFNSLPYERALVDDYERNYVLPTFTWAEEYGIDLQKLVMDNAGKNCVELLVRALAAQPAPARPDDWETEIRADYANQ